MLPTDHAFFRHFWYPVVPSSQLEGGALVPFTLLDERLVIWRADGQVNAVVDRCSHRSAKLSCGTLRDGNVVCPYHGWAFNGEGECVVLPQRPAKIPTDAHRIKSFQTQERYGYVWVALEEPICDIAEVPEALDPDFRWIPCFYERWQTSAFRTMENELDMAHFSFVHTETFGDQTHPVPLSYDLTDRGPHSLHLRSELATVAPEEQAKNTNMPEGKSSRVMDITWYMPFTMRLDISYESGLKHVIINCSTPVTGSQVQVVQFHYRNDTEAEVPAPQLIAFESKIVAEDRAILEITDPSVDLDNFHGEAHMPTDRAGLMMRRKLSEAIKTYDIEHGL